MKNLMKNLIIVPVGSPVDKFIRQTHYTVEPKDHWRWTNNAIDYHILAVQYGDFEPEPGSYHELLKIKGQKWQIIKEVCNNLNLADWDYIGMYDDDVIIDYKSMNRSFEIAKQNNFEAFQISLAAGSESQWVCTQNIKGAATSSTNFIEIMAPVIRSDYMVEFMKILNSYDVVTGWGIDYILSEYFGCPLNVIHEVQMLHPPRPDTGSGYDKSGAFKEMDYFLTEVYPRLHQEKFNRPANIRPATTFTVRMKL